jgi:mono/diheme cytochrome c family protein
MVMQNNLLRHFYLLPFACCLFLLACSQNKNENSITSDSPKFTQYYNQGKELYEKNCGNRHQKNGTGLARLYPPLNKSDFVDNRQDDVICLIRNGKKGELTVNGIQFNQPMRGIPTLTDLEIAEIATYLYNSFGRSHGIVEVQKVTSVFQRCPTKE